MNYTQMKQKNKWNEFLQSDIWTKHIKQFQNSQFQGHTWVNDRESYFASQGSPKTFESFVFDRSGVFKFKHHFWTGKNWKKKSSSPSNVSKIKDMKCN